MFEITRIYRFCASHRLHRAEWSEERNQEVFGPSAHKTGHGHNFRLTVVVEGPVDPETSRVIDLREMDEFVERQVLLPYDHMNLNKDVSSLAGKNPTLEMVLMDVWERLSTLPRGELKEVTLRVDEFLSGTWRGPSTR